MCFISVGLMVGVGVGAGAEDGNGGSGFGPDADEITPLESTNCTWYLETTVFVVMEMGTDTICTPL